MRPTQAPTAIQELAEASYHASKLFWANLDGMPWPLVDALDELLQKTNTVLEKAQPNDSRIDIVIGEVVEVLERLDAPKLSD